MIVLSARCRPSACVYGGLVAAFRPRLLSASNQRVLTRVMALSERSSAFRCGMVSNRRSGMPVSVSVLPFSKSAFPVVAVTDAMPANRSAGSDVSLLFDRSSQRSGMPWNRRAGIASRSLPPRSKCAAFGR